MIFWILIFFLGLRLYPYFFSSLPLGYDAGLYLYLFKKFSLFSVFSFTSLPSWLIESFQPGIAFISRFLDNFISPEKQLIPLIVFFNALLLFSIYLFSKKLWNNKTALWTALIFTCSAIQYRFYWYFYLKNIASLSFLFFAFTLFLSQSYWALIFTILVAYFHQQTAVFMLLIILFLAIFQKKQRIYYSTIFVGTIIAAFPYYFSTFNNSLLPLIQPILNGFKPQALGGTLGIPSGTFYNFYTSLLLSLPYLIPGIYGFFVLIRQPKYYLITIPFLITSAIVIFNLFFARRFIPFWDIFLIILAGYGITKFFDDRKSLFSKKIFSFLYIAGILIFISIFIYKTGKPLIDPEEITEISQLNETENNASILVTDEKYTSWVYGWSNRTTIAPGFGENDIYWTENDWQQFWLSDDRQIEKNLLLKLPKPLYIYNGDRRRQIKTTFEGDCFERINWRTYKFICDN